MMVFGLAITWGGAIVCFRIAFRKEHQARRLRDDE